MSDRRPRLSSALGLAAWRMRSLILALVALLTATAALAVPANPAIIHVKLVTSAGPIAFARLITEWRENGEMEGLRLT